MTSTGWGSALPTGRSSPHPPRKPRSSRSLWTRRSASPPRKASTTMATGDRARTLLPYYELARQGRVFTGNVAAAGVVLPIYSHTTQQLGLWNPAGSAVDVVLLRVSLTYIDTTGAAG